MLMPGRKYSSGKYRYGFNGKENDNEVKGDGNLQDFNNRIYDSRISKWLSLDPLQKKYPGESNYIFTTDNPIYYLDIDGRDKIITHIYVNERGQVIKKFDVIASDKLVKVSAKVVSSPIDSHDYVSGYEWHDVNQTVVHMMRNGIEVARDVSLETLGKIRTTTYFGNEGWAKFKANNYSVNWEGGIIFYSKSGGGEESKKTKSSVYMEDIDALLSLIDGMKDIGKLDILENTFLEYASKGSTAEHFGQIISRIERFLYLQEADNKQKEVSGNSPFDKKENPEQTHKSNSSNKTLFERGDDYGLEKKGTVSTWAYTKDSVIKTKKSKDGKTPDTMVVIQR